MRVIAGTARGRNLVCPRGDRVRPTLDRVREALFSSLQGDLVDARFLDLFAGSGANGIEALSRGAATATFIDAHPESLACVRQNLQSTGLASRGTVHAFCLPEGLSHVSSQFDVVFADPPYGVVDYMALLEGLCVHDILLPEARVIIEHANRVVMPKQAGRLELARSRRYGNASLSFYA